MLDCRADLIGCAPEIGMVLRDAVSALREKQRFRFEPRVADDAANQNEVIAALMGSLASALDMRDRAVDQRRATFRRRPCEVGKLVGLSDFAKR